MAESCKDKKQKTLVGDGPDEPIAITAMSGLFAGGLNLDDFWRQIVSGTPAEPTDLRKRWGGDPSRYYDKDGKSPEKTYQSQGFAIDDDNLPGQNAAIADRQVRIGRFVIETLLKKINPEPSNPPGQNLSLSDIGLVCGTSWSGPSSFDNDLAKSLAPYQGMLDQNMAHAAASYGVLEQLQVLGEGLGGPKQAVDTACASSLYAMESAINQIRGGEVKAMVVCGLSVSLPLNMFSAFSMLGALSRSGKITPFTALHDGIMIGEGAAAILLEPLSQAKKRRQPILGVISAWGLSADGCDRSIFAPGPSGLALLFERTYQNIDPAEIDYIEAHGTGTPTGDQTEIKMLHEFFSPHRPEGQKIPLGSVKAIVGHTLAAAGLASILKVLLMLTKKIMPPHIEAPMHPDLAGSCLTLLDRQGEFAEKKRPRKVAVNALGFGGANAHFVIESYDEIDNTVELNGEGAQRESKTSGMTHQFSPIAIVDVDGQFGKHTCLAELQQSYLDNAWVDPKSMMLSSEFCIERAGLRAGPNFLKRIDPWQLLLIEQAGRILRRQPQYMDSKETGVIVVTNHGGEMSFKLSRRSAWMKGYDRSKVSEKQAYEIAGKLGPEPTMEAIGSGLPALCSGYPAFHFNLSGFHKTISGGNESFFNCLKLMPNTLKSHAKQILLGAAHALASERVAPHELKMPSGEAAGFLLLKDWELCQQSGDQPLAVIRAIIDRRMAGSYEGALRLYGISEDQIDTHEICQCAQTTGAPSKMVTAQRVTGFLHEATGLEAMISVVLRAQKLATIEVRERDQHVMTIVIQKLRNAALKPLEFQEPLTISFRDRAGEVAIQDGRSALIPASHELSDDIAVMLANSKRVMQSYLHSQGRILSLLNGEELPADISTTTQLQNHLGIKDKDNIAINAVSLEADKNPTAQILVDERHTYFFDHPLDHVPGILLLEAVIQLSILKAQVTARKMGMSTVFVQKLSCGFVNYCEKNPPAIIEITQEAAEHKRITLIGQVKQGGQLSCRFQLEFGEAGMALKKADSISPMAYEKESARWLHKRCDSNVLVSKLTSDGKGNYSCKVAPPPAGHILDEGNGEFYLPLYLLESSRQFVMLLAHQVLHLPLGKPMTLVSFDFSMDRPLWRDARAELRLSMDPAKVSSLQMAPVISCELCDQHGKVGVVAIRAITHNDDEYKNTRFKSHGDGKGWA